MTRRFLCLGLGFALILAPLPAQKQQKMTDDTIRDQVMVKLADDLKQLIENEHSFAAAAE